MNTKVIEFLVVIAAIAAVIFGVQRFLAHEQDIGYQRAVAEYAVKEKAAKEQALEKERFLRQQVSEAEANAQKRYEEKRAVIADAAAATRSLRDTIADQRSKLATVAADACRQTASAALTVLAECASAYGDMAEKADGHADDVRTLSEAWPR